MALAPHCLENPIRHRSRNLGRPSSGITPQEKLETWLCLSDKKGKQTKASTLDPQFYEQLHWVWMRYPDLFAPNVNIEDDYGILWSCQQGLSQEAANQGVPLEIIEMICRWRGLNVEHQILE
jgi:hypothetical protein